MIEPESISVGDVVRLSCGSPKMTVEALRIDDSGEEVADVMLYVEGVGIDHDTVPLKHLVWPRNKEDAA